MADKTKVFRPQSMLNRQEVFRRAILKRDAAKPASKKPAKKEEGGSNA